MRFGSASWYCRIAQPEIPLPHRVSARRRSSSRQQRRLLPPLLTEWQKINQQSDLCGLLRDPRKMNKLLKKNRKDTAGRSWFDMPALTITPEIKKDLEILKLRHVIDPKRHFKKGDSSKALPKYFQARTVIEPASEFFSGRLTKKERKTTLADELLHDDALKAYRKRKIHEIQESRLPCGVEKWKNKGRQTWKRAKQRRK
ncbi:hypothetical protein OPV22_007573 [Ensete ventricosum]|uniref:Fcf2 pre-rRNA processing C-terminal domain-containing protein n=1 Tax=Ensete ventricosum TaxID=4639 RepID=A0AAV8RNT3_ENSVE|nr:hypothetical protein OPV22_007573 [Ensete ventricosum]